MRLAKVTLAGFKSFADLTEFRFDKPITGIVGPNGCGKSNVVDAIKWVLGERSAKSLRGTAMIDVIFADSAARKPLGAASVTLTFENPVTEPDAADPAQRRALEVDREQVGITRRLFPDLVTEQIPYGGCPREVRRGRPRGGPRAGITARSGFPRRRDLQTRGRGQTGIVGGADACGPGA